MIEFLSNQESRCTFIFLLKKNQFFLVIHASLNPTLKLYLRNFVELNAFSAENTINIFVNFL